MLRHGGVHCTKSLLTTYVTYLHGDSAHEKEQTYMLVTMLQKQYSVSYTFNQCMHKCFKIAYSMLSCKHLIQF